MAKEDIVDVLREVKAGCMEAATDSMGLMEPENVLVGWTMLCACFRRIWRRCTESPR